MNRPSGARPVDWERLLDDCVDFTQRWVRTPSMPGGERAVADLVAAECRAVGFDEVALDEVGNVTARMCGAARGGGGSTRGEGTNEDGGDGGAGGDVLGAIVLNNRLPVLDGPRSRVDLRKNESASDGQPAKPLQQQGGAHSGLAPPARVD